MTVSKEDLFKKDENDNLHMSLNSYEDQLEGQGEKSLIISTIPKLLRLQSVQDQAKTELKRQKKWVQGIQYTFTFFFVRNDIYQSAHEENYYLVERIKHLENLVDEMATSNQEVIDETVASTEDYKMRV